MSARPPALPLETRPPPCRGQAGTVAVLGGAGFVGAAIIRALTRAGFKPVSVQRTARPLPPGVRQVICDATRPADLARALDGAACVVNAVSGDSRSMLSATSAMAVVADGWCRMVHVSSMAVYGSARGYVDENAGLRADSRYGAMKIACEHRLAGTGAAILRPGIVYGRGCLPWVGRLGKLLRAGRLGDLGKHGDGRCNLVFVDDLAAAVVACIGRPGVAGPINLGMPAPPRWNDFLVALGRAIGAVPVARVPGWRLAMEAAVFAPPLHLAGRIAPHAAMPAPISPALLRIFAQDIVLDGGLADRLLCSPRTALADGLAESAAWFFETYGIVGP